MSRLSFRDPSTNVLKTHGYCTTNQVGDISQLESDDFNLNPKDGWQWNGSAWVGYVFPPMTPDQKYTGEANDLFVALIKELAVRFSVTPLQLINSIKSRIV